MEDWTEDESRANAFLMEDKPHDHCGVFGVWGHPEAAKITYLGIHALQHRGQESAGISTFFENHIHTHKRMGLVADIYDQMVLDSLPGTSAIGHVRYSTAGSSQLRNAQPISVEYSRGPLAIAHNGNLVNARRIKDELEAHGSIFLTTVDSEVIVHLMAKAIHADNMEQALIKALREVRGAYSLVLLTDQGVVAVRDPNGIRPLCLGRLGDS